MQSFEHRSLYVSARLVCHVLAREWVWRIRGERSLQCAVQRLGEGLHEKAPTLEQQRETAECRSSAKGWRRGHDLTPPLATLISPSLLVKPRNGSLRDIYVVSMHASLFVRKFNGVHA